MPPRFRSRYCLHKSCSTDVKLLELLELLAECRCALASQLAVTDFKLLELRESPGQLECPLVSDLVQAYIRVALQMTSSSSFLSSLPSAAAPLLVNLQL